MTTEEQWTEVLPPEKHPKLGKELLRIVGEVIADKQALGLTEKWLRGYRLARGSHWEKAGKVPLRTANLIYTHIQRTVNTLTDNNPTFNVAQTGDAEGGDVYTKIQLAAEYWWNETEQQAVLEQSIRNGETYGITIEKALFNPDIEYGIGDVEVVVVDPFHFGLYPVKCSEIQKAEVVLHFYPMTVREARRRWPEFKDRIKGDAQFLEELGAERREIAGGGRGPESKGMITTFKTTVSTLLNRVSGAGTGSEADEETLVVEAWLKDYSLNDDDTPKYRGFIRRITACAAGLLVVDDRSNPSISDALPDEQAQLTYLYDKFPFAVANSVGEAGWLWGYSDIEQLENLQLEINKTVSQIAYHKDKAVRPKVVNPKDSGVPNEHFTNVSGIINPSSSLVAQGIRYLEMHNSLQDLQVTYNLYKDLFYQVAGTFEVDQGAEAGRNVIAYKAIAALLERAATMMRGKIRNYSRLIRDRGRMFVSLMMNYYTEDRWITYDTEGEVHSTQIRGTQMIVPNKLTVVSGSTMPQSKMQQREEALNLYDRRAIDSEDLLEKMDWSGRASVLKRMKQGPMTDFIERLGMLGVDPELLGMWAEIADLPRDVFEGQLKKGEFPVIDLPQTDPATALALQEKEAEIEKVRAETQLIMARIGDQNVTSQVKAAGIDYDNDKLQIERVKALAAVKKSEPVPAQRASAPAAPGPERGLQTNNQM